MTECQLNFKIKTLIHTIIHIICVSLVPLQVVSMTPTNTTTTPTYPAASSSLSPVSSSLWEWVSTTACWNERGKQRRGESGKSPKKSVLPCWNSPHRQNQTGTTQRQLSRWMMLPGWMRTRCKDFKETDSRWMRTHCIAHCRNPHAHKSCSYSVSPPSLYRARFTFIHNAAVIEKNTFIIDLGPAAATVSIDKQ